MKSFKYILFIKHVSVEEKVKEAVNKILNDLKNIGLDPYLEVVEKDKKRVMNIIVPVEQLVKMIKEKADNPATRRYIDFEIKQIAVGQEGYIVIRISAKQQMKQ